MFSILETFPQNKSLEDFPSFENVPTCVAERRPRPHEGRSILPGDEASDGQRQLQTVRPHRVSHCTLQTEERIGGPARLESVFVLQGKLPAGLEAVVHPDRVPPLLRRAEAISAAVPEGCLREPHHAVPRQADRQLLTVPRSSKSDLMSRLARLSLDLQASPRPASRTWGGPFSSADAPSIPITWNWKLCWWVARSASQHSTL